MTYIKSVTFDCADALAQARFWAAALGSDVDEDSTPDRAFVEAAGWGEPFGDYVEDSPPD
ncbi:VOC family protein [Dactylosporangium sp. McL0621]|uniref:VOC family protein n=1 Tax=Dactylosporangium sp. McL0621 TaxID=3415678 RepID=UPI003CFB588F